jgi:hypothetical protein
MRKGGQSLRTRGIESPALNCYYGSTNHLALYRFNCAEIGIAVKEGFSLNTRRFVLGGVLGTGLLACGILLAQNPPPENIDPHRHEHMAKAQHHIREAWDEMSAAQTANDYDMQGHAAHAKELLEQAGREIKAAAEAANQHR